MYCYYANTIINSKYSSFIRYFASEGIDATLVGCEVKTSLILINLFLKILYQQIN